MFGNKNIGVLKHPGYNGPAAAVLPFITAGAAVAGVVMSAKSAKDQAKAQKASIAAQGRMSDYEARRARISAVREARMQRAAVESTAGAAGVGPSSSGVLGATGSISSQLGTNIGYQNVMQGFAQQASIANQQAADAAATGAMWGAVGNIASSMGGPGGWQKIFGGSVPNVGQMAGGNFGASGTVGRGR